LFELIFFYLGIGITLSYLFCLGRSLGGASVGGSGASGLVSLGFPVKLPFFILLLTALLQALHYSSCPQLIFVALSVSDKSVLRVFMVFGVVLGYCFSVGTCKPASPLFWLEATRGCLARLLLPLSTINGLESRSVQGLGLSRSQEVLGAMGWSQIIISQPVCLLFLVMCLC